MWAFVPPAPKELTPAVLGRTLPFSRTRRGQGACSRWTSNGIAVKSMFGLRRSACRDGTSSPCRIWSSTLVIAAMPAADSACPMFDLTEPMGSRSGGSSPKALSMPVISTGSPSAVPVPCASR